MVSERTSHSTCIPSTDRPHWEYYVYTVVLGTVDTQGEGGGGGVNGSENDCTGTRLVARLLSPATIALQQELVLSIGCRLAALPLP